MDNVASPQQVKEAHWISRSVFSRPFRSRTKHSTEGYDRMTAPGNLLVEAFVLNWPSQKEVCWQTAFNFTLQWKWL